jgi:hypothetical protein
MELIKMFEMSVENGTMRISEILYWSNEPTEAHFSDTPLGPPSAPLGDGPTNLANAFTRIGRSDLWTSAARFRN